MEIVVNAVNAERIEHSIAPPMKKVVTLPIDGPEIRKHGLTLYISSSVFAENIPDDKFLEVVGELVQRLKSGEKK